MGKWARWAKPLSKVLSIAGLVVSLIKVIDFISHHKSVIIATLELDPIIVSAFFQWLAVVFALLTCWAFWSVIRKAIKTPNEPKFRKFHPRIIEARDLLPDDEWAQRREYMALYAKNVEPVLEDTNKLRNDLKELDIHIEDHVAYWRDKFDQLTDYSRVGDLKNARKNFLD